MLERQSYASGTANSISTNASWSLLYQKFYGYFSESSLPLDQEGPVCLLASISMAVKLVGRPMDEYVDGISPQSNARSNTIQQQFDSGRSQSQ